MRSRCLMLAMVAVAAVIALTGCAGTVDLKDYTFQPIGPMGIPAYFYNNDQSLAHWYTMPYVNPYD